MDTKSDIWSLGIILHKLIFFTTPFHGSEDFAALQHEIIQYPGWASLFTVFLQFPLILIQVSLLIGQLLPKLRHSGCMLTARSPKGITAIAPDIA